jgi:chromosome segregation ATPase
MDQNNAIAFLKKQLSNYDIDIMRVKDEYEMKVRFLEKEIIQYKERSDTLLDINEENKIKISHIDTNSQTLELRNKELSIQVCAREREINDLAGKLTYLTETISKNELVNKNKERNINDVNEENKKLRKDLQRALNDLNFKEDTKNQ